MERQALPFSQDRPPQETLPLNTCGDWSRCISCGEPPGAKKSTSPPLGNTSLRCESRILVQGPALQHRHSLKRRLSRKLLPIPAGRSLLTWRFRERSDVRRGAARSCNIRIAQYQSGEVIGDTWRLLSFKAFQKRAPYSETDPCNFVLV